MGFLIKVAFWLGLVLVLIPYDDGSGLHGEPVGPMQVLHTAGEIAGDFAGLCERKPDTCQSGRAILRAVGVRAREGARIAYEALDSKLAEEDDKLATGSVGKTGD